VRLLPVHDDVRRVLAVSFRYRSLTQPPLPVRFRPGSFPNYHVVAWRFGVWPSVEAVRLGRFAFLTSTPQGVEGPRCRGLLVKVTAS